MKKFLVKWLVNTAGIALVANIVPGISIANYKTAFLAALILGLLNAFIKPLILIITLPINILSLGVFTLFINTFVFYASSRLVAGFVISGFWNAFFGAICLSLISLVLNIFTGPLSKVEVRTNFGKRQVTPAHPDAIDAEVVPEKDKEKKRLS